MLEVVASVLTVVSDPKISGDIKVRYTSDSFCQKVLSNQESFPTVKVVDGLSYIGSRLIIPCVGTIRRTCSVWHMMPWDISNLDVPCNLGWERINAAMGKD